MNAIPTVYAGVQFRSRLEARWAAYFDLWGVRWQYEPLDLNGYIPDFVIAEKEKEWFSIENFVRLFPVLSPDPQFRPVGSGVTAFRPALRGISQVIVEVKPALEPEELVDAALKIDASGWDGEAYVVGANPEVGATRAFGIPEWRDGKIHAWRGEWWWSIDARYFPPDPSEPPQDEEEAIAVYEQRLQETWREAGNRVQWKPPRRRK
ncbi:MAG TPA: hypothetical protein VEJ18_06335 [Planctomycetota bacterium]|nr:hypothetical protein [Planctomycetota bacterium]